MSGHPKAGALLLYAPVPVYEWEGELWIEAQAINGLRLWAVHFETVVAMMPLAPGPPPQGWLCAADHAEALGRVRIEPLPMAYRPDVFLRCLPATRRRIKALIAEAQYLSFAIGGLFGDWGAVAALAAHRMGRPFAVWTDRIESQVIRVMPKDASWRRRLRVWLTHRPMAWLERRVVRRAALGLFHGRETYEHYAPYSGNPHLVHNIHIGVKDHISPDRLTAKLAEVRAGAPLRVLYVGRAEMMKGPLDWLAALDGLRQRGVDFQAEWIGDGAMMPEMRLRIEALGLAGRVELRGFVSDRARVIEAYRAAHVFLFCHLTPESPRCLIEALISGTPLIGYEGGFAQDLIAAHGGGLLEPQRDTTSLSDSLAELAGDRSSLAALIGRAAQDGAPFTDEMVFRHRCDLIKTHLAG